MVARLTGRRAASHFPLGRLTAEQVAAMVRACQPSASAGVVTRVQDVSDGIPFLVEESLATSGVPKSFAAGVRGLLAQLSDDERRVLQTAAVLGRHFDWRLRRPPPAWTPVPSPVRWSAGSSPSCSRPVRMPSGSGTC